MSLHHQHARLLARIAEIRESAYRCADREPQRAELPGRIDDPKQIHMEGLT
jgi:hypothetical protein